MFIMWSHQRRIENLVLATLRAQDRDQHVMWLWLRRSRRGSMTRRERPPLSWTRHMAAWKWRPTTRQNQAVLLGPTTTRPRRRPCTGASPGAITEAATDESAAESADESSWPHQTPTKSGALVGALHEAVTDEPALESADEPPVARQIPQMQTHAV